MKKPIRRITQAQYTREMAKLWGKKASPTEYPLWCSVCRKKPMPSVVMLCDVVRVCRACLEKALKLEDA